MLWLPISLCTAFFTAAGDTIAKAYLGPYGTTNMAMARSLAPILFLTPLLLFQNWPCLDVTFWKTLLILLPLETIALLLYMESIRISPLSLSIPFLAFTPAFIIITGWLILDEKIKLVGMLGIILIVFGSYILNIKRMGSGFLAPFKAIIREKGSWIMLIVAFIYSITSVLGKLAVLHSNPFFFACFYFIMHGIFSSIVITFIFHTKPLNIIKTCPKGFFLMGITQSLMVLSHMWAISLTPTAYIIAIKRLSVLFSVGIGFVIFKEKEVITRLLGTSLMVIGVFIIAISKH